MNSRILGNCPRLSANIKAPARWLLLGPILATGLLLQRPALAELPFLPVLLKYPKTTPICLVCHINPEGGVNNAFGSAINDTVKAAGINGKPTVAQIEAALMTLASSNHDTDGDGVGDIAELEAGTNPSEKITVPTGVEEYGCIGSVVGSHLPSRNIDGFAGLLTAVALWRTRRR